VKEAIDHANSCSGNVKKLLCGSISVTIGTCKADRHPFNDRFVAMMGEVLRAEQAHLTQDVASKEVAFSELTPAKAFREAALEQAKADVVVKAEVLEAAKQAVVGIGATLKEANAALKEAQKVQKSGDEEMEGVSTKKAILQEAQKDSLAPLLDGSAGDDKTKKVKAVLDVGKSFSFDASLLHTAGPVLAKESGERGAFDATCLEQLQAAFAAAIGSLDEQLAAGAPAKAERAAVVGQGEAAKQAAEASQTDLKEKANAAKQAKAAAQDAEKVAAQSLHDFMPDLKKCGDAFDQAKEDIKAFAEGALKAFEELKDLKEGDFAPPPPTPKKARTEEAGDTAVADQPADQPAA
jgi:chromosome segregation ATPase